MAFTEIYNVSVKTYPDGHAQYHIFDKNRSVGTQRAPDFVIDPETGEVLSSPKTGKSIERKEVDNLTRAVNQVYDIAKSNKWDWFLTLTFNPEKVDRYDYDSCVVALGSFLRYLRRHNVDYILVPDCHKDGAIHFHGLAAGNLPCTFSGVCQHRRKVFNVDGYSLGFTTATRVGDSDKCASYITGYITGKNHQKNGKPVRKMEVPKGRHRFWASRGLSRPTQEYLMMSKAEIDARIAFARYCKECPSDYGDMVLVEE